MRPSNVVFLLLVSLQASPLPQSRSRLDETLALMPLAWNERTGIWDREKAVREEEERLKDQQRRLREALEELDKYKKDLCARYAPCSGRF